MQRAARRSERRGRDGDLPTDDVFADREAYLAEKRAEMVCLEICFCLCSVVVSACYFEC